MKRSPLRRKTPMARRTPPDRPGGSLRSSGPLPPKSAKRAAEDAPGGPREAIRKAALVRDGYRCQAQALVPDVACGFLPGRTVLEPHERIPRSVWPAGDLVLDNVVSVCPRHHCWIDDHPKLAHDVGLHGYSYERPK